MADSAFKTAKFPGFSTEELNMAIIAAEQSGSDRFGGRVQSMKDEVIRRAKVAYGDVSVMTNGERLRFARKH